MARQYQSGTGLVLNVTATRQYQSGAGQVVNATSVSASSPVSFSGPVPTRNGTVGAAASFANAGFFAGSLTPFAYSLQSGTLPDGLTLSSSTGIISGTPTAAGTQSGIVVRATDTGSNTADTSAYSIVIAASNASPTFPGSISNITGTGGSAITPVNVSGQFSDTDALAYTASPAGTAWPSGLVINSSTGIISGTVATSTTTGLKVRATDTASQTVDSNAFSATLSAPASTVTGVTVSPATATVAGGATQAFTATVAGTSSPSQTVNWTTSAGSVNSSGVLTAPAATGSIQTVTVTATSAQDGTKAGTATVTVPASLQPTFTPTANGKNINGGARASVACRVAVYSLTTDALVGIKTGLTSTSAGLPPAFQLSSGAVAGTQYLCKAVADSNNADLGVFLCIPA